MNGDSRDSRFTISHVEWNIDVNFIPFHKY